MPKTKAEKKLKADSAEGVEKPAAVKKKAAKKEVDADATDKTGAEKKLRKQAVVKEKYSDEEGGEQKKGPPKKKRAASAEKVDRGGGDEGTDASRIQKKNKKELVEEDGAQAQGEKKPILPADPIPRDIIVPKKIIGPSISIMSWNVNGFKSVCDKNLETLTKLMKKNNPAFLFLQETKLQENLVEKYQHILSGYQGFFSCSTEKKGYAGTAVFIRSDIKLPNLKKPQTLVSMWPTSTPSSSSSPPAFLTVHKISYDFEDTGAKRFEGEGRTITVETDQFFLVGCYVPNAGEGLKRLDFRVNEWDVHIKDYLQTLSKCKPVVYLGDLNVAHKDCDVWNPTAKHLPKQPGVTPQERSSFSSLLTTTGFKDAFRFFYPESAGQFTFWSAKTFARPVNRGLRLDYFLCSESLYPPPSSSLNMEVAEGQDREGSTPEPSPGVLDTLILHDETLGCSDHCPIVLVLRV